MFYIAAYNEGHAELQYSVIDNCWQTFSILLLFLETLKNTLLFFLTLAWYFLQYGLNRGKARLGNLCLSTGMTACSFGWEHFLS